MKRTPEEFQIAASMSAIRMYERVGGNPLVCSVIVQIVNTMKESGMTPEEYDMVAQEVPEIIKDFLENWESQR